MAVVKRFLALQAYVNAAKSATPPRLLKAHQWTAAVAQAQLGPDQGYYGAVRSKFFA
jgi:hypothetical protein